MNKWADKMFKNRIWGYFFGDIQRTWTTLTIGGFLGLSILESLVVGFTFAVMTFGLSIICHKIMKYFHRHSVWGDAIVKLKDAYAGIHHYRKQSLTASDNDMIIALTILCNNLKDVFDMNTKADCSVSIKIPVQMVENLRDMEVRNLCRDSQHHTMRDTTEYDSRHHTVVDNTAFLSVAEFIVNGRTNLAYVNNNIPKTKGYKNTSLGCYGDRSLPYKSELVYPILPVRREGNSYPMFGFICVDCSKTNGFDEKSYEIPMIQGVADGIYDIIEYRMNKNLKANDQRTEV